MKEPFSVLMSLYHKETPLYLRESLKSVFSNSCQPDQVVLIIDGPIGSMLQGVVDEFNNKYDCLEVLPQECNHGLSYSLNLGLAQCRNDIVFRMDTDDVCANNRFERTLEEYEHFPELEVVGTFTRRINGNGEISGTVIKYPQTQEEIYKNVWRCPFAHPTVSFRKQSIIRIGSYNPNSGPRQDDYELWFRCVAGGLKCKNIPEPLLYFRFFDDTVNKNNIKVSWWRLKVGLKGVLKCHCSPIAYIGVFYPLFRSLMPNIIRKWLYRSFNRNRQ